MRDAEPDSIADDWTFRDPTAELDDATVRLGFSVRAPEHGGAACSISLMLRVSIVVPVYCGAATVPELVARLGEELRSRYDLEVVLVDDGSPDNSAEVLRQLSRQHPWVRSVFLSRNFCEHNAVMAGLNHATGDCVVIMDDDLQNPPSEVIKLIEKIDDRLRRRLFALRGEAPQPFRNFGSRVNDRVANVMLDKPKGLYLSSFKALSRFVVDELMEFDGPYPVHRRADAAHHAQYSTR